MFQVDALGEAPTNKKGNALGCPNRASVSIGTKRTDRVGGADHQSASHDGVFKFGCAGSIIVTSGGTTVSQVSLMPFSQQLDI